MKRTANDTAFGWKTKSPCGRGMEIVNKYDLAGVASWRRGLETPAIWSVMKETLENRLREE